MQFTFLLHVNDALQKDAINARHKNPKEPLTLLPIPALALTLFEKMILQRYWGRI